MAPLPPPPPSRAEIETRLKRYQRLLDLGVLWPEISERDFHTAHGAIARAAAAVLIAEPRSAARLPAHLPLRPLGIAALASGMGALLGYWIETGALAAPPPAAQLLAQHLEHGRRRAALLRTQLDRIVAAFTEHGVTPLLLKGAETAFRYFPDPGTRPMTDLDLFVRPADRERAHDALRSLGFTQGESWGERTVWLPPGATGEVHSLEINHADNPWSLDLHITLDRGYPGIVIKFGADSSAEFGVRNAEWPDDPRNLLRVPAAAPTTSHSALRTPHLSHPVKLAYLASHTSQDFTTMQLVRLVELVLVIRTDYHGGPQLWPEFTTFVSSRRLERFVYPSLELAERLVPGTLDPVAGQELVRGVPARVCKAVEKTDVETLMRFRARWIAWRLMWSSSLSDYVRDLGHALWPRTADAPMGLTRFIGHQSRRVWRTIARAMHL